MVVSWVVVLARVRVSHDTTLTLAQSTPNQYGLPAHAAAERATLTLARQNNKWVHNSAQLMECSPLVLNVAAARLFTVDHSTGQLGPLVNKTSPEPTCMWLASDADEPQPHQQRGRFLSMARCGHAGTRWQYSNTTGRVSSMDQPGTCVGYYVGAATLPPLQVDAVVPMSCVSGKTNYSLRWELMEGQDGATLQAADAKLASVDCIGSDGGKGGCAHGAAVPCLGIVRDNINISLAMATTLTTLDGAPVPFSSPPQLLNGHGGPGCLYPSGASQCSDVFTAQAEYALHPATEYILRVAVHTTRGNAPSSAVSQAVAASTAPDLQALESEHQASWGRWWNASAVDLGGNRSLLEGFYYGAQYMLKAFARPGGTIPGLLGPFSTMDPVGWADWGHYGLQRRG